MSKKISELPAATVPLDGTELFEIVQGGINKQVAKDDVSTGGGGAVDSVNGETGVVVLDAGDVGADPAGSAATVAGNLTDHINDAADAHDASAISFTPAGNIGATDVQAAIEELDASLANTKTLVIACSDEVTPITATTGKVTFRMPFAMTLSGVRASLTTGQTSGSIFTVDINEGGSSILSTKLTIDNGEKTSTTAATPAVISDSALADDAEITIDVDQIGDTTAKGLKVTLIGS